MELTKQQRHECYIEALERYNKGREFGICASLELSLSSLYFDIWDSFEEDYRCVLFDEFMAFKPDNKDLNEFWWPTAYRELRIDVLKSCIEQTKP